MRRENLSALGNSKQKGKRNHEVWSHQKIGPGLSLQSQSLSIIFQFSAFGIFWAMECPFDARESCLKCFDYLPRNASRHHNAWQHRRHLTLRKNTSNMAPLIKKSNLQCFPKMHFDCDGGRIYPCQFANFAKCTREIFTNNK